ncbi:MAG: hypothetical protein AB7F96_02735 [Beijerinckiaceae bacterium]
MSNDNDYVIPASFYSKPEDVEISDAAFELAREYFKKMVDTYPGKKWVVVFDWADSRRVRQKGTNNFDDIGSGLDLAAYEAHQVPTEMIAAVSRIRLALRLSHHVVQASANKRIERDDRQFGQLALV